ncbi:MAG TPA: hypothetical protein DEA96_17910 [Leptospiraceae bacterium]|nr:hypothetical protein [Spirochaetaceae bacterium]HBS06851.1 hypothetical protein [Leptospiraceae bacterium]|tara:strand:- start:116 stop:406 length:291 start_codon:yes stop_codon:yes gene_type:complete
MSVPSNNKSVPESRSSFWILGALAIFLALLPLGEEPHLVQKLKLMWFGWLQTPLDWFDLALHGGPLLAFLGSAIYTALKRFNVWYGHHRKKETSGD